uniref:MFSD2 lysolipid transporter B, sphingolipid n=1 Tax=Anas platyrhynchos platyrhynchos TaxID=8840 RepID=A0A493TKE0_ANAPP
VDSLVFITYYINQILESGGERFFQSMLPDVVDNFRLQNPHGKGQETIFYSSYVFFTKISAGIGLGISAASLEFTGYKPGLCRQSNDVILTLKILIGAVPAVLILGGLFILLFYPITEESRRETKLALEVLRIAETAGCGGLEEFECGLRYYF